MKMWIPSGYNCRIFSHTVYAICKKKSPTVFFGCVWGCTEELFVTPL